MVSSVRHPSLICTFGANPTIALESGPVPFRMPFRPLRRHSYDIYERPMNAPNTRLADRAVGSDVMKDGDFVLLEFTERKKTRKTGAPRYLQIERLLRIS